MWQENEKSQSRVKQALVKLAGVLPLHLAARASRNPALSRR